MVAVRTAHLRAILAASDTDAAAREQQAEALNRQLRQIDAAESAQAREIEALAGLPAGSPAITALRTRLIARFTELEDQRTAIHTQLTGLAAPAPRQDPELLDALPYLGDMTSSPGRRPVSSSSSTRPSTSRSSTTAACIRSASTPS